jgi:signal transduction histidine kinase
MRLSLKLPLALSGVLVLGAGIAGLAVVHEAETSLRTQAIEADRHSAAAYAAALSSHLDGARALLTASAGNPHVRSYRSDGKPLTAQHGVPPEAALAVRELARRLLSSASTFDDVALLQPDGTVFLVEPYGHQLSLSRAELSALPWVREVVRRDAPVVSDLHTSPSTGAPSVVVAVPVKDADGHLVGIWAGGLDLRRFSAVGVVPAASDHDRASYGFVTDSRGLIVAHQARPAYAEHQTDFSSNPAVVAALAGRTGHGEWFNALDKEKKLGAYQPLPSTGWAVVYSTRKDVALAPAHALARRIVLYVVLVGSCLAGVGHLMLRWGLQPLQDLSAASEAIALEETPVPVRVVSSHDEVGRLASAFATMQARLVERDAEVRRHARRLEDANRELEAFSYSVSHDLRSPLRAIEGFSAILQEDHAADLDEDALALLGRVRAATVRMGALIEDLLALSRVGRAELRRERVDVSSMCAEVVSELRAADPDREVDVTIAPGMVMDADPRLLRSVVGNLLGNAWKFTGRTEHPRIEVASSPGARSGSDLWVKDNGVGFAMSDAGRLFGAFQRLHPASEFPGSGIGLATVQRIAHRHGGQVLAWSEPGQGASFLFTLEPA